MPRAPSPQTGGSGPDATDDVAVYAGEVPRERLESIRRRGIGQFMSSMDVEPVYKGDRFIGYRLMTAPADWTNSRPGSMRPGDIVTEINGLALRAAPDAMQAWETIDFPDMLHVKFLRDGKKHHLVWRVVDPD